MELQGWTLPVRGPRRSGRAHIGRVARDGSNERWCSDSFEIACWSGEVVEVGFVLDCCDRECLAALGQPRDLTGADIRALMHAAVQGRLGSQRPCAPIQWRSDNEGMYTALETVICAERLGFEPITTPAYSPASNGLAEAFVKTMKRDYVAGADLGSAAAARAGSLITTASHDTQRWAIRARSSTGRARPHGARRR